MTTSNAPESVTAPPMSATPIWRPWAFGLLTAALCLVCRPLAAELGVTTDTIMIGQSVALTGPAAELGTEMRAGAQAYFSYINAHGGVHGRRIDLRTLDDGYEPERAAANTKKLVTQDGVFALFGYVGTPTSLAAMPIFTAAGVPFIGPFTGAEALRSPVNRFIFNVRASYFDETERLVEFLSGFGMSRIAVFYQDDAYGKAGLDGVQRAMQKRNIKIAAMGTVERNTVNVAAAVKSIAAIDPQAVIMISAYKPCAAFIKEMHAAGAHPQFLNVSFVGSKALSRELAEAGRGVGISQVVPFPWNIGNPLVRDYQRMLKQQTGKEEYSFTSLEGFIAAKVMVEGLRRTGKDLTRDKFINTLETMGELDLGGFGVRYSASDHHGSRFVDLTVIGRQDTFMR